MRYQNVHLAGFGHALPERAVTSLELEERLAPVYERWNLRSGRLELMTGIRERRHWEPGTRPSAVAAAAGERALRASGIDRGRIGCVIHASVCRDFMEPATASVVHHALGLPPECAAFDLSNACLGFANALCSVADRIELGQVEAGLVVAGEDGGPLVEATVADLLERDELSKRDLKAAFASLTIGSGAAAAVLTSPALATSPRRLVGGAALAATDHVELCQGDRVDARGGPLMATDAEALLQAGNALAQRTWREFERELGWSRDDVDRIVTHQVGAAHRRLLFETLELDTARDFPTVETLGNVGSVSLPVSFALAVEEGFIRDGDRVAMLGVGSGLHCLMLGVQW